MEINFMKLREYLFFKQLTIKELSEKIGYSADHISGYLSGRLRISKRLAEKIAKATNNEISVEELMKDNRTKNK